MQEKNPLKYIRQKYIELLPQYKVYDTMVPITEEPPSKYITIDAMTVKTTEVSKTCYEYLVNVTINIWAEQPKGFNAQSIAEDIEQDVMNINFTGIKNRTLIDSKALPMVTETNTIGRRVRIEQLWISRTFE